MSNVWSADVFHGSVERDQDVAESVRITGRPVEVLHVVQTGEEVDWGEEGRER